MLMSFAVLLEAPFDPSRRQKNSVLLAIDLTTAVADEAIRRKDSAVVAYRMSPRFTVPIAVLAIYPISSQDDVH